MELTPRASGRCVLLKRDDVAFVWVLERYVIKTRRSVALFAKSAPMFFAEWDMLLIYSRACTAAQLTRPLTIARTNLPDRAGRWASR